MKRILKEQKRLLNKDKKSLLATLYANTSFIGRLCFNFAQPLIQHLIQDEKFDDSQLLSWNDGQNEQGLDPETFILSYKNIRQIQKKDIVQAMLRALYQANKVLFWKALMTAMMAELIGINCCYQIGYIIEFMRSHRQATSAEISYLIVFSLGFMAQIFLRNLHYFYNNLMAYKIKKLFMRSIYQKSSRLALDSFDEVSDGKLITLLQSYIFILEKILLLVHYCAVAPVAMLFSCLLISIHGGVIYAIIIQVLYILLFFVQYMINKAIGKVVGTESAMNDKRVGLIYQMLTGLKTIKCFTLEIFFLKKVLALRKVQMVYQRTQSALASIGWALLNCSGYAITLVVLLVYWKLNYYLEISFSFSTITILGYLSSAILSLSLGGMTGIQQFLYIIRKIGTIFDQPEMVVTRVSRSYAESKGSCGIKAEQCSFTWAFKPQPLDADGQEEPPKLALQNIDFNLRTGELMVIIGFVGSGKTTLLKSILNETKLYKGDLEVKGSIAYVEQEPFIFPGTVKDNIIFGKTFDKEKFDNIVKICCLDLDFLQMESGQETYLQEGGTNISGGQKARISIARALYEDADIYLLDNPMAALDSQISQKVIENVIKGYLRNKCVILVTFQPKLVYGVDKLLVLDQSRQIRIGTTDEIYKEYGYLNDIVQNEPSEAYTSVMAPSSEEEEFGISIESKSETPTSMYGYRQEEREMLKDLIGSESKGAVNAQWQIFTKFAYGMFGLFLYILLSAIPPALMILSIYWLGLWSAFPYYMYHDYYLNRFLVTVLLVIFFTVIRNIYSYFMTLCGATNLHALMIERVLRGYSSFFDQNPIGKLITRFSKDQFLVDQKLNFNFIIFSEAFFACICTVIYAIYTTRWAVVPSFIVVLISVMIYRKCSQALAILQAYENLSRDPLQANIITMLNGVITCRAYDNIRFFQGPFDRMLNKSVNASFSYMSIIRWQGLRIQIVGGLFTLSVAWIAILLKQRVNSDLLSVLMVFVMDISEYILVAILFYSEFNYCVPSVERMLQLTDIRQEDELRLPSDEGLKSWPFKGQIKFKEMTMKYREELQPAVNNVSFEIEPGMKVGVVGRTGAGKSSILQSLFRLVDLHSGSVEIDEVDIKTVGLHTLRQSISYIPQTAFLFSGTVRENLDPFRQRTDEEIIDVLKKTYLWDYVSTLPGILEHFVINPSLTFSQGGRQLMCLARELLRDTKIMVLDEATASIDYHTDQLIQRTLRENCKTQTMLTIAHRISTVIDSDRILVMDSGKLVEYDHPFKLLTQKDTDYYITSNGAFAEMVKAYNEDEQMQLFKVAQSMYLKEQAATNASMLDPSEVDALTQRTV